MAVLGICSLKGGVGKTSITLGLASAAIYAGLKTLVVDLDPQADTTMALGVLGAAENDVAAVLDNPSSLVVKSAIAPSPWNPDLLHAVVGSNASARHDGPSYAHRLTRLKHALESLNDEYDLILVDCPPSLGGLTRQGLTSCDRALIVTELGLFSVTAAGRAFQAIDEIRRESAPNLQPLGVLVNRVRARSSEQAFRQEELTKMFGPLILTTYIPERSALQQAQGAGSPIHAWPSRAARDLADRFDAVLSRALRSIARDKQAVQLPGAQSPQQDERVALESLAIDGNAQGQAVAGALAAELALEHETPSSRLGAMRLIRKLVPIPRALLPSRTLMNSGLMPATQPSGANSLIVTPLHVATVHMIKPKRFRPSLHGLRQSNNHKSMRLMPDDRVRA